MSDENRMNPTEYPAVDSHSPEKDGFFGFIRKNAMLTVIVMSLVCLFGVYLWKDIQSNNRVKAISSQATAQLKAKNEAMLLLICKPLIWSIRSEMLRGNMEQVNIFTTDLVREPNFQYIHLVDTEGTIIVSTDKKLEGTKAEGVIDPNQLLVTEPTTLTDANQLTLVAAPVMGYDRKLGVLLFGYQQEIIDFKE